MTRIKRNILLNPGPVTTTHSVKEALLVTDICHREREFTDLLQQIRQDLLKVACVADDYTSVLFTASGTGAIEAALSSVVPNNKKIAIINNGSYGQRMVNIAKRYNIDVIDIVFPYHHEFPLSQIETILQNDPDIDCLAMVHHETSSGLLNPIEAVGDICDRLNRRFIVDAMSSFGGTEIDMYKSHIDYIISSSNKCLHGMPGLSFVICHKEALQASEGSARSYYFDLHQQYHALETSGQMPFTPPVQIVYAFKQALNEYFSETAEKRFTRFKQRYNQLSHGLKVLGFNIITPEEQASSLLMSVQFPASKGAFDFDHLHDHLFDKGYTIYPRKLSIDNSFRLSCIGDLNEADINNFLSELASYMANKGNS